MGSTKQLPKPKRPSGRKKSSDIVPVDESGRAETCVPNVPFTVPINTLEPESFDLVGEIKAVVHYTGDDYVASFVDANVNSTGATIPLAVDNLKDRMLSLYQALGAIPAAKLGKWPTKQLAILQALIKPRS